MISVCGDFFPAFWTRVFESTKAVICCGEYGATYIVDKAMFAIYASVELIVQPELPIVE